MIERQFIAQKTKEYYIKQYIENKLKGVGISQIKLKKIPLGEKIIIYTSRPSLIVGSKGANIRDLTRVLKQDFKLENPQIEINEVKNPFIDAMIVAERIASSLERFGSARFKSVGHKIMENVIKSGALGIEVIISGKIPGARAKSWRFYQGYLKKCGDIATTGVQKAKTAALLKTGIIGIQVSIMPPDIVLPDYVNIKKELTPESGELKEGKERVAGASASEEEKREGAPEDKAKEGKGKKKSGAGAAGEKVEKAEKGEKKKPARKKAENKESKESGESKEKTESVGVGVENAAVEKKEEQKEHTSEN